MKTISNIIQSDKEPNTRDLWLNNGVLKYYSKGKWLPLNPTFNNTIVYDEPKEPVIIAFEELSEEDSEGHIVNVEKVLNFIKTAYVGNAVYIELYNPEIERAALLSFYIGVIEVPTTELVAHTITFNMLSSDGQGSVAFTVKINDTVGTVPSILDLTPDHIEFITIGLVNDNYSNFKSFKLNEKVQSNSTD